jgi:hypothetical protein
MNQTGRRINKYSLAYEPKSVVYDPKSRFLQPEGLGSFSRGYDEARARGVWESYLIAIPKSDQITLNPPRHARVAQHKGF